MGEILLVVIALVLAAKGDGTMLWILGGIAAVGLLCALFGGKGGSSAASGERPRVRIDHPHVVSGDEYECTVCGRRFDRDTMTCPHCGVRFTDRKTDYEEFDDEEDEMEAWDEEEGL